MVSLSKKITLIVGLSFFLSFAVLLNHYYVTGFVLGSEIEYTLPKCGVCDIRFHLMRSILWGFRESVYTYDISYAPMFHVLLGLLIRVGITPNLSWILLTSIIGYCLIPLSIFKLSGLYNKGDGRVLQSCFICSALLFH